MTKDEMVLRALERIIYERGKLRAAGLTIDALPDEFNQVIDAARAAHHKLKYKQAK